MGRRDCVVVNAVDAGGRVEAEPCGSCRLVPVVVGQRRQASSTATLHTEPAASWARQRHSLHLLIFWGSEGGIYCCLLKVASNTIHSSSSSREQQSLCPALLPYSTTLTKPRLPRDTTTTTAAAPRQTTPYHQRALDRCRRRHRTRARIHQPRSLPRHTNNWEHALAQ